MPRARHVVARGVSLDEASEEAHIHLSVVARVPAPMAVSGFSIFPLASLAVTCRHVVFASSSAAGAAGLGEVPYGLWCYDLFADAARDGAAALRETAAPDPFV